MLEITISCFFHLLIVSLVMHLLEKIFFGPLYDFVVAEKSWHIPLQQRIAEEEKLFEEENKNIVLIEARLHTIYRGMRQEKKERFVEKRENIEEFVADSVEKDDEKKSYQKGRERGNALWMYLVNYCT